MAAANHSACENTSALCRSLAEWGLLTSAQEQQLADLQEACPQVPSLIEELVQRGWLTSYQVALILAGQGETLVLGDYVLLDLVGQGGMGQVFKARHRQSDGIVAVKTVRKDRLAEPQALRRFRREMEATGALKHANIVRALDAAETDGTLFFVMEFVEGIDLGRLVDQRGPLPLDRACEYIRQAALGLQHAHEQGLVHRDIKPSNLFLTWTRDNHHKETIKILDLGLARFTLPSAEDGRSTVTREGVIVGTPDYISPEQIHDPRRADIRADIYSLGCTLYHLIAGNPPFHATDNWAQKLVWHQGTNPLPLEQLCPGLPPRVASLVRKMMAKRPEDRFQTPGEVAGALQALLPDLPPSGNWDPRATAPFGLARPGGPLAPRARPALAPATPESKNWGSALILLGGLILALGVLWFAGPNNKTVPSLPDALSNSIGMKLRPVKPGSFLMGSPEEEPGREQDERRHRVRISQLFHISAYEVTQGQYEKVMGSNPSYFCANGKGKEEVADLDTYYFPVENVSWNEAVAFCKKLSESPAEQRLGWVYRLPTEAEWEYACRGGGQAAAEQPSSWQTNFDTFGPGDSGLHRPTTVGSHMPNALGLFDMHGNVWEWCADWYAEDYPPGPVEDPTGPAEGKYRVRRGGGAWFSLGAHECRCANRDAVAPDLHSRGTGFRVVMEKRRP
jgi:serine/threonine protein kinase